jgi:DNA-binding transcriptional ArsR family regulator
VTGRSKDQDLIDWLAAWMDKPDAETAQTNGHSGGPSGPAYIREGRGATSDELVIEKCRGAENAARFADLFDHGNTSAYGGNASDADYGLLGMLKFYTQDPDQLDRLMRRSALARSKWDENRAGRTWLRYSIDNALRNVRETYDWTRHGRARPLGDKQVARAARPYIGKAAKATSDDGEASPKLSLVRFAKREAPAEREFIVPDLIPRHHPTTLYGWGGTAKSLLAMLLALSVAGGREKFFGRDVAVQGSVLYIDFELDADEQQRRVIQLATGLEVEVPEDLLYVSTLGVRTHEAIEFALSECEEHKAVMAVLDSLGPAMVGDMSAAKDVIEFHNCYIAPFKAVGVTPLLVDHQARQQVGEGYQSKGAFGSAYKEHLSRSLIQVEAGDRSAEQGTLNIRLRHKKTNFGALAEPFDVSLSFSDEMILATTRDLTPSDRAQEATLNSKDRVRAALEDGPAYPDELAEATGLTRSTVKNAITALKKAEIVEVTGEVQRQMERVRLVAPAARPIKGRAARATSGAAGTSGSEPDDSFPSVAELFADPPGWLSKELPLYHQAPERYIDALCAHVAAVVLYDPGRRAEVREEVERELARQEAGR